MYGLPNNGRLVHTSVASIGFVYVFVCRKLISSFQSLRAGSQVFDILMLFLCVILHTIWMGNSLQLLCILYFSMLCLSDISVMFVKKLCWQCVYWWYGGLSECGLCVFRALCPVSFLVVGKSRSLFL